MCVTSLALDKPAVVGAATEAVFPLTCVCFLTDVTMVTASQTTRAMSTECVNIYFVEGPHQNSSGKSTESNRIPVLQQCKHHTMMYAVQIICANDFVSSCLECGCVHLTDRGHW